jgi:hypothetical protein
VKRTLIESIESPMNQPRLFSRLTPALVAVAALVAAWTLVPGAAAADEGGAKKPLPIKFPEPTLRGTPEDLPSGPNIEPPPKSDPAPYLAPADAVNLSAGKPVTSSVKPFTGELSQVTDGKKEAFDSDAIEMRSGSQWVQVDLGASAVLYAIVLWHDHRYIQITRDVIVQVSDDPEFKQGVTTLYNNDFDDSSKKGPGTDKEYFETKYGKIVEGKGTKARYVRGYSKGTSLTALNCWQEIEVYGAPAK